MLVMEEQVIGVVERIVFGSDDTGFIVARWKEPKQEDFTTIVGKMPGLQPGESVTCKGIWKHHPSFGRQFEVQSFATEQPSDLVGIQRYLESGLIKGIGPVYAKRIVKEFGTDTLRIIEQEPEMLLEVEGMGRKRLDMIVQCWGEQAAIRDLIIFLRGHGIAPSLAQKIYKRYGDNSIEVIKENPYQLAKSIFGVGFKTADDVAQKIGIAKDAPVRVQAAIEHLLWELSNQGHSCYPKEKLLEFVQEALGIDMDQIISEMENLESEGRLVRYPLGPENKVYIWVKPLYLAEVGIARELKRIQLSESAIRKADGERALVWVEEQLKIKLAPEQKTAVLQALEEKAQIITGGPGTGKSTITHAILRILEKISGKIYLAAPTGRAAKRLSEITRRKAQTIHALLEVDFSAGGFKRNKENPLECELLIVDEASMIDTQLMYSLLRAIPNKSKIIFIGDVDQLPSVGPGNVLRDLIDSEKIPVTVLRRIFRQAQGSKIVTNAHRINRGIFPDLEAEQKSDFFFLPIEEPEAILEKVMSLVSKDIPEEFGFDPIRDVQVLAPMKKGPIGIENLNHHLQQKLNPGKPALVRMGRSFRPMDKVMQIRNNYTKFVYNGDVGTIEEINQEEQVLTVDFEGKIVDYSFSELNELVLAYACSIHKYQGSECPAIVIPIHTSHFKLLYRNLLYTGITRGKKLVVLVGTKKAVSIAVNTDEVNKRHTGLRELFCEC